MKENYTFPVILSYNDEDTIDVSIPNFEDVKTTVKKENYIEDIQEYLAILVDDYESSGKKMPEIIDPEDVQLKDNQKLIFINLWMPYFRSKIKIKYVKKTLTIPTYLDILAKEKNINFSHALVKALKEELGIVK